MRARIRHTLLAASFTLLVAVPVAAQDITGSVVVQGWDEVGSGAAVSLLDSTMKAIGSTTADAAGHFRFTDLAAGGYYVQASIAGAQSAVSTLLRVTAERSARIDIVVPSPMLVEALSCRDPAETGATGVLVGTAYEAATGLPLPGAGVVLEWGAAEPGRREVLTDRHGHYVVCDAPSTTPLDLHVTALGRAGSTVRGILIEPGAVTRQDLSLGAAPVTSSVTTVGVRPLEDGRTVLVEGVIVDAATSEPVPDVAVRLADVDAADVVSTSSGSGGRFSLTLPAPGRHVLLLEHLGFGSQRAALQVESGTAIRIEVRLAPRAVELDEIAVAALSAGTVEARATAVRRRVVRGADLEAAIARGQRITDVVRDRFPLRVHEGTYVTIDDLQRPRHMICVQTRRVDRMGIVDADTIIDLADLPFPFCEMVAVIVDGVPMARAGEWLRSLNLDDFEHIEYLSPLEAGSRWGRLASTNGALLLWTRGRSPVRF